MVEQSNGCESFESTHTYIIAIGCIVHGLLW